MLLGAIADDFTGATDLANTLVQQGMQSIQTIGTPQEASTIPDADAVVVALKSRTIAPADAVNQSLEALDWLRARGAQQIFFKYCSTFDSTDEGNIGPVADALLEALGTGFTIACPAFPATGRTLFKGHLFVGDVLLSDSGMKDHPLTPMRDPNLANVLSRQTRHSVGLVQYFDVEAGAGAVKERFDALRKTGCRYAIVDACSDAHLLTIGEACAGMPLVTGGSGVALGLPDNFRAAGLLGDPVPVELPKTNGRRAVLAGSCSQATLAQVAAAEADWPSRRIDPRGISSADEAAAEAVEWALAQDPSAPAMFYSSREPDEIRSIQAELGRNEAGALVEQIHAAIARSLVNHGFDQVIVAGGETSGAVVSALGVSALVIGPEIDPGVPWTSTTGEQSVALALKSGNFGTTDFFAKAFRMLDRGNSDSR